MEKINNIKLEKNESSDELVSLTQDFLKGNDDALHRVFKLIFENDTKKIS